MISSQVGVAVQGVTWLPLRGYSGNTYGISGMLSSGNANVGIVADELGWLARMPASKVTPLLATYGVIWGSAAEIGTIDTAEATQLAPFSGLTQSTGQQSRILCTMEDPTSLSSDFIGLLTHEWHHAIDCSFGTSPYNVIAGRSAQGDVQALWTRAQTFWAGAPNGQSTYYGWKNVLEFWAELGRCYWIGTAGGTLTAVSPYGGATTYDTGADSTFRGMISGYGTTSDDSFITSARAVISGVVPLGPPPVT